MPRTLSNEQSQDGLTVRFHPTRGHRGKGDDKLITKSVPWDAKALGSAEGGCKGLISPEVEMLFVFKKRSIKTPAAGGF